MAEEVRCSKCGAVNSATAFYCSSCKFNLSMKYDGPPVEQMAESSTAESRSTSVDASPEPASDHGGGDDVEQVARSQYENAYIAARTIIGVGSTVKAMGVLVGFLAALAALMAPGGMAGTLAGLLVALILGLLTYLSGVFLAAQGQLLRATLDVAVNTSRLAAFADAAN